jgi:hypothetical protein
MEHNLIFAQIFLNPSNISKLMKKTFFLLFSAGILFSINAKAQSVASPSGVGGGSGIIPDLGGEWSVVIVVSDSKGNPVSGAKVTLPCSGESYELTNAEGNADFSGSGTCPCTESLVNVNTSKSNVNQDVSCGTNDVTLPQ